MSCGGGCDSAGGGYMGSHYPGVPRPPQGRLANPPGLRAQQRPNLSFNRPPSLRQNQPYTVPGRALAAPHQMNMVLEESIPGRDDLADRIMEDVGAGGVWNEASAMSLSDYQESYGDDDDESCPPCEMPDDQTRPFFNRPEETPSSLGFSPRSYNFSQETPPFHDFGLECEPCAAENSLELHQMHNDALDISSIAEAPSNISVYDAEELNITTAPRNTDLGIPRNRIWQTLSSSLDEAEQDEEQEYMQFVVGLQNQRRQFFESSFD